MKATAILSFVRRFVSGNPIRWLVLGGALLITAIVIGTTIMAANFRERALNSAERELENTVLLLTRHFDRRGLHRRSKRHRCANPVGWHHVAGRFQGSNVHPGSA